MLRLFLRFFGLEWSVAERKTEKSRRRFEGLTASLRDGMPRDSYSRECGTACSSADSFLLYFDAVFRQHTFVCSATVLTSAVAVENKSLVSPSKSQGIGKRPLTKLAVDVFTHFISNHLFVFQIHGRIRSDTRNGAR